MSKSLLLALAAVLVGVAAPAMIQTLTLPELVKEAACIVLVTVKEKTVTEGAGTPFPKVLNTLSVDRVLKGEFPASAPFTLETFGTKETYVEDSPVFPDQGDQALVFLKQGKDGAWDVVNRIQGVWPIDKATGQPLGMGTDHPLSQVEDQIRKP